MDASPDPAEGATRLLKNATTPLAASPQNQQEERHSALPSHNDQSTDETAFSSADHRVESGSKPAARTNGNNESLSPCRGSSVEQLNDTTNLLHELANVQLGEALLARYLLNTSGLSRRMATCSYQAGRNGDSRNSSNTKGKQTHGANLSSSNNNNISISTSQDGAVAKTPVLPASSSAAPNEPDSADHIGSGGSSSSGSTPVFRFKIMLLGHQQVGKTSLRRCLESEPFFFMRRLPDVRTTTGVEVSDKMLTVHGRPVRLVLTDFAGQESYHSHTFFLTQRAIFVLVWKISAVEQDLRSSGIDVSEEERLDSWIAEVSSKYPGARLVLVATHLDELRVQGQRNVDIILSRVEHRLNGFLDRIAARSAATATAAAAVADTDGISPAPSRCRIVGNFAVSCKTRQVATTTRAQGSLFDNRISALAQFLAKLAREGCVEDAAYANALVPRTELRFAVDMDILRQGRSSSSLAMGFNQLLGLLGRNGNGSGGGNSYVSSSAATHAAVLPPARLCMSMREFVERALQSGVEPTTAAVLRVANLLHDWDVIYLFARRSLKDNMFVLLQPRWLNRISAALFSFAHILRTPLYLRSMIGKLEYTVSVAQTADMLLMRKGYLRWPLARVLFHRALNEFLQRSPDDTDVAMCLYLLQHMQLIYPVSVYCDDGDIAYAETPCDLLQAVPAKAGQSSHSTSLQHTTAATIKITSSHSGGATCDSMCTVDDVLHRASDSEVADGLGGVREAAPSEGSSYRITRYFIPSLSPQNTPRTLIRLAPMLFHRGVRLRMEFNLLPDEMWWRLQCRLHDLILPVTVFQPGGGVTAATMNDDSSCGNESLVALEETLLLGGTHLRESDEEHNRWLDALWLGDATCRVFVYREERTGLRVFTAEQTTRGAEAVLQRLESEVTALLQHYAGVQRCLLLACPSVTRMCAGWVDARVVASSVWVSCPMCGEAFEAERFITTPVMVPDSSSAPQAGSSPMQLSPRETELFTHYPDQLLVATADLFTSCLGYKAAQRLCRFIGIPYYSTAGGSAAIESEEYAAARARSIDNTSSSTHSNSKNNNERGSSDLSQAVQPASGTANDSSDSFIKQYPSLLDKILKAILFNAWVERTEDQEQRRRMLDSEPLPVYY